MVTGASGQLGRLTVAHLRERVDAAKIIAVTRSPERVSDLGVTVRQGNFDEPDSLVRAFDGAERVLVISGVDLGRRVRQHRDAFEAARKAGAGHVLYTSMARAGEPGNPLPLLAEHRETERVLSETDMPFTVLRNNIYAEILPISLPLREAVATGVLAGHAGAGFVPYVTRADCAAVAAAVLSGGGHEGQLIDVSGPVAVDHAGIAAALTEATGRPVRYEWCDEEQERASLMSRLPPEVLAAGEVALESAFHFWRCAEDGWFDVTTHVVERLTGRRPTTLAEYFATQRDVLLG